MGLVAKPTPTRNFNAAQRYSTTQLVSSGRAETAVAQLLPETPNSMLRSKPACEMQTGRQHIHHKLQTEVAASDMQPAAAATASAVHAYATTSTRYYDGTTHACVQHTTKQSVGMLQLGEDTTMRHTTILLVILITR